MNKTVNINLAGIFFHIDEDAYLKLQRYLEAIKHSFTDSQGRSEILSDIEGRIAELFNERMKHEKQVISATEVEEVIAIMGQPEDYIVDEEIFEDEPQPRTSKSSSQSNRKLFRDIDNAYVGGVASGLSHYFNIDPLWIRLIWVLLFFGAGTGIFIYILLWCLMPSAETTAEKLSMTGKPVNITNIEQKVREGFSNVKDSLDEVTDKVKNGDYTKKVKSNSRSFFDALGDVFIVLSKIIAKFIGVILIIVGAFVLIALFISLFSLGTSSFFSPWWIDYVHAANITGGPLWLISLITFFAVGIPFFLIFLLGLKILVNNLKSIGRVAKFTLLGLWLVSILTLATISIKEFSNHVTDASTTEKIQLNIDSNKTLNIKMLDNENYYKSRSNRYRNNNFRVITDDANNKKIYSSDIQLIIRTAEDSIAVMHIEKSADGRSYQNARDNASKIEYNYSLNNNELQLDSYLLTDLKNKYKDQEIRIIIYLPEGTTFKLNRNTRNFISGYRSSRNIISYKEVGETHKVIDRDTQCVDCKTLNIDLKDENSKLKLNKEEGLKIKDNNLNVEVNNKETVIEGENIKITSDSTGLNIKSKDN